MTTFQTPSKGDPDILYKKLKDDTKICFPAVVTNKLPVLTTVLLRPNTPVHRNASETDDTKWRLMFRIRPTRPLFSVKTVYTLSAFKKSGSINVY